MRCRLGNFTSGTYQELKAEHVESVNPSTVKVLSELPNTPEEEVAKAVSAASEAFPNWSRPPKSKRTKVLIRIADFDC